MRKMLIRATLLIALTCCMQMVDAQYRILGFVYDAAEDPYAFVEVQLKGEGVKEKTTTDHEGRFEFHDVARGDYVILVITQYGLIEKDVRLRTSIEMHLQRSRNIRTDEVVVSAVRADEKGPVVQTNITEEELEPRNLGQDVPYLLKWTPSLVATSDAGTGIGYTGLRIRGTDPTRINVTINGVPLNDAESQAVFWVDLPDFLSSAQSVQIQRGVGTSTYGTGAFGASVNINTTKTYIKPRVQLSGSAGSFNTYKGNVQFSSGLIGNHWTIDGRLSTITSDGYIDRASADLKSYFGSIAYIGAKSSLRLTAFGGHETTYQAWNGVPVQYIEDPELRTFNTAGMERAGEPYDNEVDDYTQHHVQLHWNTSIFTQIQSYVTAHYTKGRGYFEQYKSPGNFGSTFAGFLENQGLESDDVVRRRWLDNDFYGVIGGVLYTDPTEKYNVRIGGGYNRYLGDHFGEVIWSATGMPTDDLPNYYENDAVKTDGNVFTKVNYRFGDRISALFDLQLRSVRYEFDGLDNDGTVLTDEVRHTFFNPKAGLTYTIAEGLEGFYFAGIANREPNRDDYVDSSPTSRPQSERLYDQELGLKYATRDLFAQVNGYWMHYRDHLTITGRLNDVGAYTRQNVDEANRLGVEVQAEYKPWDRLSISGSMTLSRNRVKTFTEFIDNWDYWNQDFENTPPEDLEPLQFPVIHEDTELALSPSFIGYLNIGYDVIDAEKHHVNISLLSKRVGDQYIDNTGNPASLLEAYSFSDLQCSWDWKITDQRTLSAYVLVRNIFDSLYESNAWIYRFRSGDFDPRQTDPYAGLESGETYHLKGLFPQAGRNILVGVTLEL